MMLVMSVSESRTAEIRVLIADDHAAVRSGVSRLLGDQPDMRVLAAVSSAGEAIQATAEHPDVAVIDYHLGDRDGLWVARRVRRLEPRPRVLLYSAFCDEALAVAAIVAGVDGLLGKSAIGAELCLAVRRLAGSGTYLPTVSAAVVRAMGARLPERRRSVLAMLVHGVVPAVVGARLGLDPRELDAERSAILAVLAPASGRAGVGAGGHAPLRYGGDRPARATLR
jgi:DNA-binding NarL/FixJ family response regulator